MLDLVACSDIVFEASGRCSSFSNGSSFLEGRLTELLMDKCFKKANELLLSYLVDEGLIGSERAEGVVLDFGVER